MKREENGRVLRLRTNAIVFGKKFRVIQSAWWGDLCRAKKTETDYFDRGGGINGLIRTFQG